MAHSEGPDSRVGSSPGFGALLADHRKRDGRSQLSLSLDIGISSRHLGFLETGRASPSTQMVLKLAEALDLLPIETNQLLLAAGFAPRVDHAACATTAFSMALGIGAFEAGVAIAGCQNLGAAQELAAAFLRLVGIESYMTGTLRIGPDGWQISRDEGGNPALGWLRHNEVNGYRDKDYLVRATAGSTSGFFWSDAARDRLKPVERRILDEAEDYGITNGFVMPIHMGDGSVRALSSWGAGIDTDVPTRLALSLVTSALIERIIALGSSALPANAPVSLKERHREILGYVAEGHSPSAIGRRLMLSETEVGKRLHDATATLGCASPASAACRAVALELI